jgi:hypothetical protein
MLFLMAVWSTTAVAQRPSDGQERRGGFSLSSRNATALAAADTAITDSVVRRISAWRLSPLGNRYEALVDSSYINAANHSFTEGRSVAMAYTGNIGGPSQSRIFSERDEERHFIFANPYDYYIITGKNASFYDTKLPYSNIFYTRGGGTTNREEQLKILLTTNFGKKINVGGDFDYIYSRGYYQSNGNKIINYRFFGSYRSDHYEAYAHVRNANIVNSENGGLTNDRYITHPDEFADGKRKVDTHSFPTRFTNTWNRVRGGDFFLSHRYNLGFYREMTTREQEQKRQKDELKAKIKEEIAAEALEKQQEENLRQQQQNNIRQQQEPPPVVETEEEDDEEDAHANEVFVPVSSIIHTFEYENYHRRFISTSRDIDACYTERYGGENSLLDDLTTGWAMQNTLALSLREGFQDWAKFGLTAFARFEQRRFFLPGDSVIGEEESNEFATYVGAEISKQQGQILTYQARGELCTIGEDYLGNFRLSGNVRTRFPLFGKIASIQAEGYLKNLTPPFYTRHHHGRYFWWDQKLKNTQRVYVGGAVGWEQTHTQLSAGVENITNHVFFNTTGIPEQYGDNLQVVTGRLKQDFRYKALGWENELVYQLSSNNDVLPLPQLSAYTNLYLTFQAVKVLSVQMGVDAHYYTSYYAPYYEPATQQFQTQNELKMGNYPLINAYINFHLHQARFFVSGYNLGTLFINHPQYFSMPHYPLNPMLVKIGISVYFNN